MHTIPQSQLGRTWLVLKLTAEGFVDDDAWSHGASIAYFTLFSIAPVLLVVIAVAGMSFGNDAAQGCDCRRTGWTYGTRHCRGYAGNGAQRL